jgi:hypothetical protein
VVDVLGEGDEASAHPAPDFVVNATFRSRAIDELLPATCHVVERYANNPIESITAD